MTGNDHIIICSSICKKMKRSATILGTLIIGIIAPGKHNFSFDGSELQPGTYLYRVETSEVLFTGKFMKSR